MRVVGTIGALCAVLASGTAHAFRTAADLPELAGSDRVAWNRMPVQWSLDSDVRGLSYAAVESAISRGLSDISAPACTAVEFRTLGASSAPAPGDGRNTMGFLRTRWTEKGFAANAVATTDTEYVETSPGHFEIVESDTYYNADDHEWHTQPESVEGSWSVEVVARHEGMHQVGALHPCTLDHEPGVPACGADPAFEASVMHPLYLGPLDELGDDDAAAVCFLYPQVGSCDCSPGELCDSRGECRPDCGGAVCLEDEQCVDGGCVRTGCQSSRECEAGARCLGGACVHGGELADPCDADADCLSGVCAEGSCSSTCACPAGFDCDVDTDRCRLVLEPFGSSCERGEDCVNGLCLSDSAVGRSYCTRTCDDERSCPPAYECAMHEGNRLCIVTPMATGCSSVGAAPGALGVALLAVVLVRRRKR
jgi:uncharacterized protein (TIGR03382 family)